MGITELKLLKILLLGSPLSHCLLKVFQTQSEYKTWVFLSVLCCSKAIHASNTVHFQNRPDSFLQVQLIYT
jgi:hypothetical protein